MSSKLAEQLAPLSIVSSTTYNLQLRPGAHVGFSCKQLVQAI